MFTSFVRSKQSLSFLNFINHSKDREKKNEVNASPSYKDFFFIYLLETLKLRFLHILWNNTRTLKTMNEMSYTDKAYAHLQIIFWIHLNIKFSGYLLYNVVHNKKAKKLLRKIFDKTINVNQSYTFSRAKILQTVWVFSLAYSHWILRLSVCVSFHSGAPKYFI